MHLPSDLSTIGEVTRRLTDYRSPSVFIPGWPRSLDVAVKCPDGNSGDVGVMNPCHLRCSLGADTHPRHYLHT